MRYTRRIRVWAKSAVAITWPPSTVSHQTFYFSRSSIIPHYSILEFGHLFNLVGFNDPMDWFQLSQIPSYYLPNQTAHPKYLMLFLFLGQVIVFIIKIIIKKSNCFFDVERKINWTTNLMLTNIKFHFFLVIKFGPNFRKYKWVWI